ncbi:two-component system response regulator CreB [Coraliomargarita sp. SDUM461003]|uniref:Two-component system response regulator CreB n=1 Tax=Thalassobacterium maritimum TaxID=3041265 RepID=A0ABU1AUW9_9BACT|nr:two-component system response regulator CreB [Coraliomargarita sp. SDUM461003]MDQ8207888.1 two-component system response regulator CreB [Coraliomargarita sp. SDUM461003]
MTSHSDKLPRVLVVEDEPSIRDSIVYALESEGFAVDHTASGGEALSHLQATQYALVVLDVGLPDMNGFDLCRDLRLRSQVPVIFLTARASEVDRVVGLELGADDYVTKPFSPRELSARVRANIRRAQLNAQPAPLPNAVAPRARSGLPFEVDYERWQICYYSSPLTLSRYEFRLLVALIEKPGRVYSRAQLMDLAWEEPDASMERTVDTHIKSVRAKLKSVCADVDPIVTHRGIGYSMREHW